MKNNRNNDIWVLGDIRNQALLDNSLNVLAGARELSTLISDAEPPQTVFVVLNCEVDGGRRSSHFAATSESNETGQGDTLVEEGSLAESSSSDASISTTLSINKEEVAGQAIAHGADRVLTATVNIEQSDLDLKGHHVDRSCTLSSCLEIPTMPGRAAKILADLVESRQPAIFLFPLNQLMREIAARSAFLCHSGLIADCLQFKYENGEVIAICPSHGGEIMAELGFSDSSKTGFITVQPHAFKKQLKSIDGEKDQKGQGGKTEKGVDIGTETADILQFSEIAETFSQRIEHIQISTSEMNRPSDGIQLISRQRKSNAPQSLETADKVVAGGAGLGNIEGFRRLRKLAAALGAQIGATRPPVLWHWTDEESLIGQTGKMIKPELLISVGTSGAVQYTAGITQAKTVIAVNRDPAAPIFQFADIGIVEDAATFLPLLTDKVQKAVMRSLADSVGSDVVSAAASEILGGAGQGADFGSKLMQMRNAHQLTVDDLAEKTKRTPEFIEALEKNQTTPSVGFMIQLAEVFGVDSGTFLNQEEQAALSENRAKEYTRRTANYHYQTLTPGAENEHLRVFMVTIESNKKHKPVAYRHEGEEFVYVMDGTLELTLDGKPHKLMTGESMKFNSQTPHQLKSVGITDTKCLVTLYTP